MVLIILMFACALALSGVAAFYAIFGLVAIFAAAPTAITIMGTLLEGSKLVVASWLYRNWSTIPVLMKSYFIVTLVVLMGLTSMGIFGFLSQAHSQQSSSSADVSLQVAEIDRQIQQQLSIIQDANTVIGQLDGVVQQLTAAQRIRGADGALAVRLSQTQERQQYSDAITQANTKIADLQRLKLPLEQQQNAVEAKVGPLKYIAAMIYGEQTSTELLEKTVRWLIIIIVGVFDPLAVILLIAANWSLVNRQTTGMREQTPTKNTADPPIGELSAPEQEPVHHTQTVEDSLVAYDSGIEMSNITQTVEELVESLQSPVENSTTPGDNDRTEEPTWRSRPPKVS